MRASYYRQGVQCVARVVLVLVLLGSTTQVFGAVPEWLRTQAAAAVPAQSAETDAVVLYDEMVVTAAANGKIHYLQRRAIRILRVDGAGWGTVKVNFDDQTRITNLRGWAIPESGKPFEVNQKQAIDTALYGVENGELVSDLRTLVLRIPAVLPGTVVGYEWEQDQHPYFPLTTWDFQESIPVLKANLTLKLPAGWTYHANWLNHVPIEPVLIGQGQWHWSVIDQKAIRQERGMPPWRKIASHMSLELLKAGSGDVHAMDWSDLAKWYLSLASGRQVPTPEIKQKVAELVRDKATIIEKMSALSRFVQTDIRYVAIELGIGGFQPHQAADVLMHRYGDCKDKATLLATMLREIGVESHYVLINTERGAVNEQTAPNIGFNHVILALVLPQGLEDASLIAVDKHPVAGRLLFFDPTAPYTPLGRLDGMLQANFGLLVNEQGGELLKLPQLATKDNYVTRTAQLKLSANGDLSGDLQDVRVGDAAARARANLQRTTQDSERIKSVETLLADSIATFTLQRASIANLGNIEKPFEWRYTFEAPGYAKQIGDLMMVRPWVVGSYSSALLETKEARQHPIEFDGPALDSNTFEIEVPEGYVVDELPPPLNIDIGYAIYQSKTELAGRKIRYARSLEIKQLAVPVEHAEQLKQLYRSIYNDERRVAILRRSSSTP